MSDIVLRDSPRASASSAWLAGGPLAIRSSNRRFREMLRTFFGSTPTWLARYAARPVDRRDGQSLWHIANAHFNCRGTVAAERLPRLHLGRKYTAKSILKKSREDRTVRAGDELVIVASQPVHVVRSYVGYSRL